MARKIVLPPFDSGTTQPANTVTDVRQFENFTVFAATGSVVSLYADNGTTAGGSVTIGASGYVTITDVVTFIKVNAVHRIVGLFSHDGG